MRKGFTLPEILVYSVLLLMFVTAVYGSFSLSRDYFSSMSAISEVQQEAMKGVLAVERELNHAEPSTIAISTSPVGVRLLSALPAEGQVFQHTEQGELLWQQWVVVYLNSEGQLVAKRSPINPASALPASSLWPSVTDLASDASLESRVLARNVAEMSFPSAPAGLFRVAVRSRVEQSRLPSGRGTSTPEDAGVEATYQGEIPLRNRSSL